MFSLTLRRFITFSLICLTFFATAFNFSQNALADAITRDATNLNTTEQVSDSEYESAKAERQRKQAMRSERAEEAAEREKASETISEKLNLDEIVETVAGDRPATQPANK